MAAFDLAPGSVFAGRFRIRRLVGQGGMGSVYAADHLESARPCALKVMRVDLVRDPKLRDRFALEARVGSRIQSEHVVKVLDAGVDEATGLPWLAMELLEGEDLASIAGRLGLAMPHMRELFAQLGEALAAAHAAGVVHRDLKPENVFVARSENRPFAIKILDFGLAKVVHESLPIETTPVGTVLWMAPEQTEHDAEIAPSADLWAIGLLAFWLVTGRYYWKAAEAQHVSVPSLLRELIFEPIEPASRRAARYGLEHLPRAFDEWFGRCVVRSAESRFGDTAAAFAALDAVLARLGTPPPKPATRLLPTAPTVPLLVARSTAAPGAATPAPSAAATVLQELQPALLAATVARTKASAGSSAAASVPRPAPPQPSTRGPARSRAWLVVALAALLLALGGALATVLLTRRGDTAALPQDTTPAASTARAVDAPRSTAPHDAPSPDLICNHMTAVLSRKPAGHAFCLHNWGTMKVDQGYRVLADCLLQADTPAKIHACQNMRRPPITHVDGSGPAEP